MNSYMLPNLMINPSIADVLCYLKNILAHIGGVEESNFRRGLE